MDRTTDTGSFADEVYSLNAKLYATERNRYKISTTTGVRAIKYEEKTRKSIHKQVTQNCWKVTMTKENRPEKINRWEKQILQKYKEAGSKRSKGDREMT